MQPGKYLIGRAKLRSSTRKMEKNGISQSGYQQPLTVVLNGRGKITRCTPVKTNSPYNRYCRISIKKEQDEASFCSFFYSYQAFRHYFSFQFFENTFCSRVVVLADASL